MDVYVARQPIFDRPMNIFGYELLYRRSTNNFYEGVDDNQATAALINNSFLVMKFGELTHGAKAFINFSAALLESEVPLLLPKETLVVEILERVAPTASVIDACKKLKKNGYILALDDFVFTETYLPLIELADIIKIEFPSIPYEKQQQLIKRFSPKIKFLAEKIETREEYHLARKMGYSFFQGYFLVNPLLFLAKKLWD